MTENTMGSETFKRPTWDESTSMFIDDEGCPHETLLSFAGSVVSWCGCGLPEKALGFLRDVLRAYGARQEAWRTGIDTADPQKRIDELLPDTPLALSFLYFLDAEELLEHGSSIYGSWPTEKGKWFLALLDDALNSEQENHDET